MGANLSKKQEQDVETICGIVMPISKSDDDHTAEHWAKVQAILAEAIKKAGCKPQPVWTGSANDIIQDKILKNLFENEIVVCDLSTKNANVMLEVGMRLTTKKPTLLVAEEGTKLPFDTAIISTEFYDPSLEWGATGKFIETLAKEIREKHEAWVSNEYRPYISRFEFETVEPSTVSVTSEEHLGDLISRMSEAVNKAERMNAEQNKYMMRPVAAHPDADSPKVSVPRFLGRQEASKSSQRFSANDYVEHEQLGGGVVLGYTDERVAVEFDRGVILVSEDDLTLIEKNT